MEEDELNEQLRLLKELQEIDIAAHRTETEIKELNNLIKQKEESLKDAIEEVERLSNEIRAKEIERKNMEGEIRADEEVVKRWESRLKDIKGGREYQALMREISLTKKEISAKEDKVLEIIEQIDKDKEELKDQRAKSDNLQKDWSIERDELQKRINELEEKIKLSEVKRKTIIKSLPPSLLQRYDRIRKQRDGLAIVETKDYICMGCNMNIPPQIYNQVLKMESIISCPHCQRILHVDDEVKVNA